MKIVIDYILSVIYLLYFGLILVIFHGIQWVTFTLFGSKAHQQIVHALNFCLVYGWYLTGSSVTARKNVELPTDRSILFIANHQSMFDIPGIIWFWRQHIPKFVAKKELAKGIPSISYNLRVANAALIDRKDGKAAVLEIAKLGKHICENTFSAAIFPEGTRSRTGKVKEFNVGGVATLLKRCPNLLVVPLAIEGTQKFNPKGLFPLRSFSKLKFTSLTPIEPEGKKAEEVVAEARNQILQIVEG
ncbi:1-acyl-sn-glycerol-3-phosphate acyltransferase [Jiulongibacter sediminis]|uniref:lysophospholipid acyltransferase family protein n=1 Tax=Jiulongibacter sediminis TaxID=1605367 RepID=UPI0026E96F9F|nr:1-acyl-sn-glycerol-3-phosphate acyltransferase [Jiulongibacter sediminis]